MPVMLNQLARFAPVAERMPDRRAGRLLDVGAGSEGITPWLPRGWSATALDSDWDDYGSARRIDGRPSGSPPMRGRCRSRTRPSTS